MRRYLKSYLSLILRYVLLRFKLCYRKYIILKIFCMKFRCNGMFCSFFRPNTFYTFYFPSNRTSFSHVVLLQSYAFVFLMYDFFSTSNNQRVSVNTVLQMHCKTRYNIPYFRLKNSNLQTGILNIKADSE